MRSSGAGLFTLEYRMRKELIEPGAREEVGALLLNLGVGMTERKELIERLRDATEGPRMLMNEAATTLEADAPAVPQEPVRNDMSIQLLERLIKTLTNLGYATPEGGIEAFNADLPTQLYHLCFGVDRVLSALKTAVPQEPVAWQPIETAPKDGSRVLLWWDGAVREGWCAGAGKSRDGGDWWRSHSPNVCAGRPTQWMPLPPAPEGSPQKSPVLTDAEIIQAIEQRFAPAVSAVPVAYLAWRDGKPCWDGDDCVCEDAVYPVDHDDDRTSMPVYLAPQPQRPRLTDAEIHELLVSEIYPNFAAMVRAVEKKVRGEA